MITTINYWRLLNADLLDNGKSLFSFISAYKNQLKITFF